LLIVGISPTLDVAHTSTVVKFLNEERLVYLPILFSDDGGERKLGVARNIVDGGLATVAWSRGGPFDGGVCWKMVG